MPSRETRFVLRIESGERQGEQVPLALGTLQVGRRPDCGLVLKDGSVSGRHAELHVAADRVELADLGSTNGTRVNGEKIPGPVKLEDGDRIQLGESTLLRVTLVNAHEAAAASIRILATRGEPSPSTRSACSDG